MELRVGPGSLLLLLGAMLTGVYERPPLVQCWRNAKMDEVRRVCGCKWRASHLPSLCPSPEKATNFGFLCVYGSFLLSSMVISTLPPLAALINSWGISLREGMGGREGGGRR